MSVLGLQVTAPQVAQKSFKAGLKLELAQLLTLDGSKTYLSLKKTFLRRRKDLIGVD